jgi:hypothetical protein
VANAIVIRVSSGWRLALAGGDASPGLRMGALLSTTLCMSLASVADDATAKGRWN